MTRDRQDPLYTLARKALGRVREGQTVGLGTGRAASAFIRALGQSGIRVKGVATSRASQILARRVGIDLISLEQAGRIDLDVDGADEVDPRLDLIKGYGGALVREKVIAEASQQRLILVGTEKLVRRLGARGRLPVEVIPFAASLASRRIKALGLRPSLRTRDSRPFLTDNRNLILDCAVGELRNPTRLERELLLIPGVVGTGLFLGIADVVLVARPEGGVSVLRRKR